MITSFKSWLKSLLAPTRRTIRKQSPRFAKPRLESLEERMVLNGSPLVYFQGANYLPMCASDTAILGMLGRTAFAIPSPFVTITSHTSGGFFNSNITISGRVSEPASGIVGLQAQIDGGAFTNVPIGAGLIFAFETNLALDNSADGAHSVRFQGIDAAGNVLSSVTLAFTLDTLSPAAPTNVVLATASDSGASNSDRLTNVNTPTIQGQGEAGAIIRVLDGATQVGQGTVAANGTWQVILSVLGEGPHTLTATASDAAGNVSLPSAPLEVAIDTVLPTSPAYTLDPATNTGAQDDYETATATVNLVGTADAGATVTLVQRNLTVQADANGNFTFTGIVLNPGSNSLTTRVVDLAGNQADVNHIVVLQGAPQFNTNIANLSSTTADPAEMLALTSFFSDVDMANTVVRFDTVFGTFDLELFDSQKPITVSNFLKYLTDNDYDGTIIHRTLSNFVVQGGGFEFVPGGDPNLVEVPTDPTIQNEPGIQNTRGTIAMAKVDGDPNSATSQWFINLGTNTDLNTQNGGFTVFGRVLGSGMTVIDQIAAVPRFAFPVPLNNIPLRDFEQGMELQDAGADNFVLINDVSIFSSDLLTFTIEVVSESTVGFVNSALTVTANTLVFDPTQAGTGSVRIRATDAEGNTVTSNVINISAT